MATNKVTKSLVAKRLNINSRYVQGDPNVISDRCSQRDLPFPVMRPYEHQGAMYMIPPMPENLTRSTYASVFFSSPTLGDLKRAAEQLGVKKKASKTLNRRNLMAIITGYMLQHKVKEPIFIKKLKSKSDSCIIRRANSNKFNNLNNTNSNNNSLARNDENYLKNNLGLTPKQINNYRNANNKQNYLRNSVGLTQTQVRSVPVSSQTMSFVRTPPSQMVNRIASMPQTQRTQVYNSIRRELPQATGGQLATMKNTMARLATPQVKNFNAIMNKSPNERKAIINAMTPMVKAKFNNKLVDNIANANGPKPRNWTGTRTTVVEHKANKRVADLQSRINTMLQKEKKIEEAKKNVQKSINSGVTTIPRPVQMMVPAAAKTQNMNKIVKALENMKRQSANKRQEITTQRTTLVEHKANKRVADLQSRINKMLKKEKNIETTKRVVQKWKAAGKKTELPRSVQAMVPTAAKTQNTNKIMKALENMKRQSANKRKEVATERTTVVQHKANKRVADLQSRINTMLQKEKKIEEAKKNVQKSINAGVTTISPSIKVMVPSAAKTQNMNKVVKALENLKRKSATQRKEVAIQASKEIIKATNTPTVPQEPRKPGFFNGWGRQNPNPQKKGFFNGWGRQNQKKNSAEKRNGGSPKTRAKKRNGGSSGPKPLNSLYKGIEMRNAAKKPITKANVENRLNRLSKRVNGKNVIKKPKNNSKKKVVPIAQILDELTRSYEEATTQQEKDSLIQQAEDHVKIRMPSAGGGQLTDYEIDKLKNWIDLRKPVVVDGYEVGALQSFTNRGNGDHIYPNKYKFSSPNAPKIETGLGANKPYDIRDIRNTMNRNPKRTAAMMAENQQVYRNIESKLKNVGEKPLKLPSDRDKFLAFANNKHFRANDQTTNGLFTTYKNIRGGINMNKITPSNREAFESRTMGGITNKPGVNRNAIQARVQKFLQKTQQN